MDRRRECILVLLSVFMVMKYAIVLAIFTHYAEMVLVLVEVFIVGRHKENSQRISWQNEQYRGFLECTLLRSYLELDFSKQLRMSVFIFKYLCTILELVLKKEDTNIRASILVECRIAITLSYLRTGNILMMVGDWYSLFQ